jgi:hypothetical protein
MERFRGLLITIAVLGAIALLGVFFVFSATAKAYSCGQIWNPDPSPSATPGPTASGDLGYVQPDMGNRHSNDPQTYAYCPPASGTHINNPPSGPIPGRVYGPDDFAQPNGWIHNLEHGARVVLYKCPGPGCTDEGQAQLKAFFPQLPNPANCATVMARFDEMKWPFAAIVWDRVLPLDTLDTPTITRFFSMYAQKTNPEGLCPRPSASPGPSGSAGASASPAASSPASVAPTGSGSAAPSASPS